jgi:hypothetical protein
MARASIAGCEAVRGSSHELLLLGSFPNATWRARRERRALFRHRPARQLLSFSGSGHDWRDHIALCSLHSQRNLDALCDGCAPRAREGWPRVCWRAININRVARAASSRSDGRQRANFRKPSTFPAKSRLGHGNYIGHANSPYALANTHEGDESRGAATLQELREPRHSTFPI